MAHDLFLFISLFFLLLILFIPFPRIMSSFCMPARRKPQAQHRALLPNCQRRPTTSSLATLALYWFCKFARQESICLLAFYPLCAIWSDIQLILMLFMRLSPIPCADWRSGDLS
ncbi:hypothetical protein F4779DRAFT_539645 [Xylariaceae sp. FL0662B]|nr:hypothetical protein F4779DRAFT_539645 [Xylariaceae sp. FL0662B]